MILRRSVLCLALLLGLTPLSGVLGAECPDAADLGAQHVSFTLGDGIVTVNVTGIESSQILDVIWAGHSILEKIEPTAIKDASSFAFGFSADFSTEPVGVLEVWLDSGQVLVRGIPDDLALNARREMGDVTKATCASTTLYSVSKCGGTTSSYTVPYKCCDNNYDGDAKDSSDGNCVWLAWVAARNYGWLVPSNWGNASNWCDKAAATTGWTVSTTPVKSSIACSKSIGHVGWVTSVDTVNKKFTVTEQNCKAEPWCAGTGTQSKTRAYSNDWKFIRCTKLNKCGAP